MPKPKKKELIYPMTLTAIQRDALLNLLENTESPNTNIVDMEPFEREIIRIYLELSETEGQEI